MKAKLIKKKEDWYNLYNGEIGIGSTHEELQLQGYKLSLKNCQAIERGYDLDELATKICGNTIYDFEKHDFFRQGFQEALELIGDKKFSEEDVISMIEKSRETGLTAQFLILTKQQTEWDVEVEMVPAMSNNGNAYYGDIPKLDAEGCLILKKI